MSDVTWRQAASRLVRAGSIFCIGVVLAMPAPPLAQAQPRCVFLECGPSDTPNPQAAQPPAIGRTVPAELPQVRHAATPRLKGGTCREIDGFRYCVSSVLAPQYGFTYGPENLVDADLRTAWVEGRPGHGEGERLLVDLGRAHNVTAIQLMNGYHKNNRLFLANSRVRQARLTFSDGAYHIIDLEDGPGIQTFELGTVEATWVQFEILSVFPGTKYKDTAVTEFRVVTR